MSREVNLIYATNGWGGNEIIFTEIGKTLTKLGINVNIYVRREYASNFDKYVFKNIIISPFNDASIYSVNGLTIILLSSFLSGLKLARYIYKSNGRIWLYAPFWGYEWTVGVQKKIRIFFVKYLYKYFIGKKIIFIRNDFEFINNFGGIYFPNISVNHASVKYKKNLNPRKNLLCIGRIDFSHKCQDKLLKYFSATRLSDYYDLIFLGDGVDLNSLNTLRSQSLKKDFIKTLGWGNSADFFNENTILVIPSNYEGLPLVALEAIASNVPVIATREAGVASIINKNSIFSDVDSFVNAIQWVDKNKSDALSYSRSMTNKFYTENNLIIQVNKWVKENLS